MDFVEANRRQLNNLNLIEESLDEYMTNALEDEHMGIEGRFFAASRTNQKWRPQLL